MQSSVWNLIAEGRRPVGRLLMVATAVAGVVSLCAPAARAQDELAEAVEWARLAWLGHDVSRLVSRSDTVRLNLPGVARAASLRPAQAAKLLRLCRGAAPLCRAGHDGRAGRNGVSRVPIAKGGVAASGGAHHTVNGGLQSGYPSSILVGSSEQFEGMP
jgi:hypothetical protein